jgi:hypothetical protein
MHASDEFFNIFQGSEVLINLEKIFYMVTVIGTGFAERRYPEGVYTKILQIGQSCSDASDISPKKNRPIPVYGIIKIQSSAL